MEGLCLGYRGPPLVHRTLFWGYWYKSFCHLYMQLSGHHWFGVRGCFINKRVRSGPEKHTHMNKHTHTHNVNTCPCNVWPHKQTRTVPLYCDMAITHSALLGTVKYDSPTVLMRGVCVPVCERRSERERWRVCMSVCVYGMPWQPDHLNVLVSLSVNFSLGQTLA